MRNEWTEKIKELETELAEYKRSLDLHIERELAYQAQSVGLRAENERQKIQIDLQKEAIKMFTESLTWVVEGGQNG
jgi:hypothetical protein